MEVIRGRERDCRQEVRSAVQALRCYKSVIIPPKEDTGGAKSECCFMEFTYEHVAIMYARACRAWYAPRAHRIVKRRIEELVRAGDHEGVEAWSAEGGRGQGGGNVLSLRRGLLCRLLTSPSRSRALRSAQSGCPDTPEISRGKIDCLPRAPAGFTTPILDGCGLRDQALARPIG